MADVAQITVESTSTAAFAEGPITITKPTGLEVGDLMVLILAFYNVNTTPTPSGWTVLSNSSATWGLTNGLDVAAFYKEADSGDVAASNSSFDVTDTTGDLSGTILRISGFNPDNIMGATEAVANIDSTSGTDIDITGLSLTPNQSNSLLIAVLGSDTVADFSSYASTGSPTWTEVTEEDDTGVGTYTVSHASYPSQTEVTSFTATASTSVNRADLLMFEVRTRVDSNDTNTLLEVSPTQFTQAGAAEAIGSNTLLEVSPETFTQTGKGTSPTQWTNETKPSTTWTNEDK